MCADELHQSRELLVAFGLGQVDEAAAKTVAEHLETCADCLRVVTEAPADDFLHRVREAAAADALDATISFELAGQEEYEIVREIGRGGMGVVYLARNRRMDRLEALKVMQRSLVERRTALDRFEQEIRSAARLHHPNIVTAYNAPHWGGALALAMEYVPGEDLHQLVQLRGPMNVVDACLCGYQAALALQHAHEKGMVHRDIKPSNLMLTTEGGRPVVKVLDFGLSKATSESPAYEGLTMEGQLLGSQHFIAPEQAIDAASAGIRADLYSLGCTLYYLLAGRPPFQGKGGYELIKAHEQQSPEPLDAVRPDVPPALAAVIAKLMAKKPEERFRTPAEAAEALLPFTAAPAPAPETKPRRRRSTAKRLGLAAALAGYLALVAAAAYVIRIQTGEGEVVVTSEVDGIAVDVERNGQTVKDGWQIRQGADNRWVVRSGVVNVTLPAKLRGEFTLAQDTARLVRDGKILVTITRKAAATPQETPVAAAMVDRDRAAAEWVLAQGGKVGYTSASGVAAVATAANDLPSDSFQLFSVGLAGAEKVVSADLDRLVGLSRLYIVVLDRTNIDAGAILRLAKMPALSNLFIDGTRIKSSDLVGLAPVRKLGSLTLAAQQNDDGYAALAQLPSLRRVTIHNASADDLRQLADVKQLRTVWFPDAEISDEHWVDEFQTANSLCRVLVGTKVVRPIGRDLEGELARRLRGKGAELEIVDFTGGRAARVESDAEIAAGKVFILAAITLPANVGLDTEELRWLSCACSLWVFRANGLSGADRYAGALSDSLILSDLSLRDSDLTDAGLEHFKTCPSLTDLDARSTKVTQAGVDALQKALPNCKIHWSPSASPPAPSPVAIDRDRAAAEWVLAQGGIVGYVSASGGGWAKKAGELPPAAIQVNNVNLWGVKTVHSTDLDRFIGLRALESLYLVDTAIDAEALERIVKMPLLYSLRLSLTHVKSSQLSALAPMRRLAQLYLDARSQNDDGWAGLSHVSPLRYLVISGATADDLRRLGKVKQLRTVWLVDAQSADEQTVAELQAANPLCRVLVGGKPVRAIGRDPVGELAKHLRSKGAEFEMELFPDKLAAGAATDADVTAGKPLNIISIKLPANVSLDDEEAAWLGCPWSLHSFSANESLGADRYAEAFAGHPMLNRMELAGSDLTDAGLEHFKQLPMLWSLDVRQTKVTQAGVDALQKALPECKILW